MGLGNACFILSIASTTTAPFILVHPIIHFLTALIKNEPVTSPVSAPTHGFLSRGGVFHLPTQSFKSPIASPFSSPLLGSAEVALHMLAQLHEHPLLSGSFVQHASLYTLRSFPVSSMEISVPMSVNSP
jgi:hypothetical protein